MSTTNDKDTYYTIYAKGPDGKRIFPIRFAKRDAIYGYDMDTKLSLENAGIYQYNTIDMIYDSKLSRSRLEYMESKYGMHSDRYEILEIEHSSPLTEEAMNYLLYMGE